MIPGDPAEVEAGASELEAAAGAFDDVGAGVRGRERQARAVWTGRAAGAASELLDDLARRTVIGAVVAEEVAPVVRRYAAELRAAQQTYTAAQDRLRAAAAVAGPRGVTDAALSTGELAGAPSAMVAAAGAAARADIEAARAVHAIMVRRLPEMQTTAPAAVPPPSPPPPAVPGEGSGPWRVEAPESGDWTGAMVARVGSDVFEAIGRTNAARHMRHFLNNSGEPLQVDPQLIVRDDPDFRARVDGQTNDMIGRVADQAVRTGRYGVPLPFDSGWRNYDFDQSTQPDWFYAMNGLSHSVTGTVVVRPPPVPGAAPTVEAEHRLHVFDRYNWDGGKKVEIAEVVISDTELQELHRAGLAREYDIHGSGPLQTTIGPLPSTDADNVPAGRHDSTVADPGRSRW